jgi:ABC-type transport system substrate-binding protein
LFGNKFLRSEAAGHSTKRLSKAVSLTAIAAAGLLALSACAGGGGTGSNVGGAETLRFGISNEPANLITGVDQGTVGNTMMTLIHRGLMSYDKDGKVVEGLAESMEMTDPTTYTFKLRPNLTFHDGSPVTANNVKASLEYYANKANGSTLYVGLQDIKSVEVKDDHAGAIHLSGPNSAFLEYLAIPTAAIVPDKSLAKDIPNQIGAGPYALKEHNRGVNLILDKFDQYYAADDVKLSEIDMSFYADGSARTNALLGGDVDIIDYVPWPDYDRVSGASGMTLDAQSGPLQFIQFNVTKGPFADAKVRQAVAYALNRENAVQAAFQGHGEPLTGVKIPKDNPAYDPANTSLFSYDVAKAKALLAEAGYPNGFEAKMLTTSQYTFLQDTALSAQADLGAIGIKVTLDAPDWSTRVAKGNSGDYDLAVAGGAGIVADPTYIKGLVSGPNSFLRSFGYDNPALNAKLDEGLRATDDASKKAAYNGALKIMQADVPYAPINTREQAFAHNSKVSGFKNLPGFLSFYSGYSFADISLSE